MLELIPDWIKSNSEWILALSGFVGYWLRGIKSRQEMRLSEKADRRAEKADRRADSEQLKKEWKDLLEAIKNRSVFLSEELEKNKKETQELRTRLAQKTLELEEYRRKHEG